MILYLFKKKFESIFLHPYQKLFHFVNWILKILPLLFTLPCLHPMVVLQKQLHQMVEHVNDCHHDEPSLPMIGLMFMVFLNEWLRVLLGFLHNCFYYILMWFISFSPLCCIYGWCIHMFIPHRLHLLFILLLCRFQNRPMCNLLQLFLKTSGDYS